MKIIEIGKCLDNNDPRGFGRIRATNIDELDSERGNSVPNWEKWSKEDPFVYSPFLPNHINVIPAIDQAVKIIRYDGKKDAQNQEYVAGPFTTPHDYGGQKLDIQITETTYGQRSKKTPDIKSFGENVKTFGEERYLRAESVDSIPKVNDISLKGNYGSDVILTEHGVQLRAGNLIDKRTAKEDQKDDLAKFPMFSKKQAKISLKKFPETVEVAYKDFKDAVVNRADIKHVLEYELDDVSTPTEVKLYLYSIKQSFGEKYKTDIFGVNTSLDTNTSSLIYEKTISLVSSDKTQEAYILIRDFISKLDIEKLNVIEPSLEDQYVHPFYFRPTTLFREQPNTSGFLEKIIYGPTSRKRITNGLIFSRTSIDVPVIPNLIKIPYLKTISDIDQTFAAITADNIFYLSQTNPGVDGKQIDFSSLSKYEYDQSDYLQKILPNTFSTVRGEKLIEILELMTLILLNHKHGITTPTIYLESAVDTLKKLINRAKEDMVNNSIRIN